MRREMPEEQELNKKRVELTILEAKLAQHELDLATLQAELRIFEARYLRNVGIRYAELDEIEAQIAETQAHLNPSNKEAQTRAKQARSQAQESAHAAVTAKEREQRDRFKPSEKLKKLYREIARRIHPDLATDEEDRIRRHKIMAEVNCSYENGNEDRLEIIIREWENSPESVQGDGIGAELIRIIRKIAQVEERLRMIKSEFRQLIQSDLYKLMRKVEDADREGRDLLAEMATKVEMQIAAARKRLADLSRKRADI